MPAAVNGLKECTKCGETQPVSEYHKNKTYSDGLGSHCRSCVKSYQKKHYQSNKERKFEYNKKYNEANKEKISEHKKEYVQKLPAAVYKIENKTTGKIYIGQSTQYPRRWRNHRFYMRHGKHDNPRVQHDYDEHGLDSFEFSIIQEYPNDTPREILLEHEQQLIDEYIAEGKELYNISRYN